MWQPTGSQRLWVYGMPPHTRCPNSALNGAKRHALCLADGLCLLKLCRGRGRRVGVACRGVFRSLLAV